MGPNGPVIPMNGRAQTRNPMGQKVIFERRKNEILLPSEGKLYSEKSSMFGRTSVELWDWSNKQNDILQTVEYFENGTMGNELVRSCLVDPKIRVEDMLICDRDALLYALRVTSLGPDYKHADICPRCMSRKFNIDINLMECLQPDKMKFLSVEPVAANVNAFVFRDEEYKCELVFKYEEVADEIKAIEEALRMRKMRNSNKSKGISHLQSDNSSVSLFLEKILIAVNGSTDKNDIRLAASQIPNPLLRRFLKYRADGEPRMNNLYTFECDNRSCDYVGTRSFYPSVIELMKDPDAESDRDNR